jgi:ABC-type multidrug transport system ATPase subunit
MSQGAWSDGGVSPVLQADQLCFGYRQQPALLDNLSVRMGPGVTWVRGAEGRGKTTLLRLLAGDLPASSGRLRINRIDLGQQPVAYAQQVFWIDGRSEAFHQLSALDYLARIQAHYPGFAAERVGPLMAGLSLTEHQHKPLYMLSTGSRRKVWLAAGLASRAAVLLLDDPFAALDKPSIAFVMNQLTAAATEADNVRAIVVAHYEAPASVPLAGVIDLGD